MDDWLCQLCGEELPDEAWIILESGRGLPYSGALHEKCKRLATWVCPHLAESADYRWVLARRDELIVNVFQGWEFARTRETT